MLHYRILPTNSRPMPLVVSSQEFTSEWHLCWKDSDRSLTYLLEMAKPFLAHWAAMLLVPHCEKDIHYITLCARLNPQPEIAKRQVHRWIHWASHTTSIPEELELLFIEHVRTANYYPTFAKPPAAEFVIAYDYKDKLRRKIAQCRHRDVDYVQEECILDTLGYTPAYPDYLLLVNFNLTRWEQYLFHLSQNGYSTLKISQITHIPRETFYYEEKHLWNQIKIDFSDEA